MGRRYDKIPTFKRLNVNPAALDEYALPEQNIFDAEVDAHKSDAMKGQTD